jgi:hypothetical protein
MLPRLVSRFPATAAEGGCMTPPESNALQIVDYRGTAIDPNGEPNDANNSTYCMCRRGPCVLNDYPCRGSGHAKLGGDCSPL